MRLSRSTMASVGFGRPRSSSLRFAWPHDTLVTVIVVVAVVLVLLIKDSSVCSA